MEEGRLEAPGDVGDSGGQRAIVADVLLSRYVGGQRGRDCAPAEGGACMRPDPRCHWLATDLCDDGVHALLIAGGVGRRHCLNVKGRRQLRGEGSRWSGAWALLQSLAGSS